MIIPNITTAAKWSPSWREGEESPPTYYFRAGSDIERGLMEAELVGEYAAGRVFDFQIAAAFESGVETLLADSPDDVARVKAIRAQVADGDAAPEERALLEEVRAQLAMHWPQYRRLIAQAARRSEMSPILAFRWFCVGWEGADLPPFEKGPDGRVKPALLLAKHVPPLELKLGGMFAWRLQNGEEEEKNSVAPSKPAAARRTSRSAPKRKTGGGSAKTSG